MIETKELSPGVTLRCCRDTRFKQGCISFQFIRRMDHREAHLNALLPSVMLRATERHPDIRSICQHLDNLYGVGLGPLVRRVGDYHAVGFYANFMDDRFALEGESVLKGVVEFLEEVLLESPLEDGGFLEPLVESEKKNLISAIESALNNKSAYVREKLILAMCAPDTFGVPRLGRKEQVAEITPKELYEHYLKIRRESPLEIFYVGSADADTMASLFLPVISAWERTAPAMPEQSPLKTAEPSEEILRLDVNQGKLCMGFVTDITVRSPEFPAMQIFNALFGQGMTSKLFRNVRENLSLCYSIGSAFVSTKGILTVSAGIDFDREDQVRQEILHQLELCRAGEITAEELHCAREAVRSSLRSVQDSPGSIEGYHFQSALTDPALTYEAYIAALDRVTAEQVAAVAGKLSYHSSRFLKGVEA